MLSLEKLLAKLHGQPASQIVYAGVLSGIAEQFSLPNNHDSIFQIFTGTLVQLGTDYTDQTIIFVSMIGSIPRQGFNDKTDISAGTALAGSVKHG